MNKAKVKDYHKVCWSCGKETMQPKGDYFQCTNCGTTYCDLQTSTRVDIGVQIYEEKPVSAGSNAPDSYGVRKLRK